MSVLTSSFVKFFKWTRLSVCSEIEVSHKSSSFISSSRKEQMKKMYLLTSVLAIILLINCIDVESLHWISSSHMTIRRASWFDKMLTKLQYKNRILSAEFTQMLDSEELCLGIFMILASAFRL